MPILEYTIIHPVWIIKCKIVIILICIETINKFKRGKIRDTFIVFPNGWHGNDLKSIIII